MALRNNLRKLLIVFLGFEDPIQFDCGEPNKSYNVGLTEANAIVSMPVIGIEKGDNISVWACKGDSCDPTSVSCYDSNGTFVKDLPNKKICGLGVSHCIRYGNFQFSSLIDMSAPYSMFPLLQL
jgi:hypothetical protein